MNIYLFWILFLALWATVPLMIIKGRVDDAPKIKTSPEVKAKKKGNIKQNLKSLGLGVLVVLPFSPITIPYILKKTQEFNIDIIPNWYKALSRDEDSLK